MLSQQREIFALEIVKGKSQADAYRIAYPKSLKWKEKSVWEAASALSANVKVASRVKELREKAASEAIFTAADVLREVWRIASFDIRKLYNADGSPVPIHELDDMTAAAIQAVDIQEEYAGIGEARVHIGYTKKYKVADKNVALEKLMKHLGQYELDNKQKTDPLTELLSSLGGSVISPVVDSGLPDDEADSE